MIRRDKIKLIGIKPIIKTEKQKLEEQLNYLRELPQTDFVYSKVIYITKKLEDLK